MHTYTPKHRVTTAHEKHGTAVIGNLKVATNINLEDEEAVSSNCTLSTSKADH